VNGTTGKYILKRALETILPHDLLYSKKRGFGAPVREWFRSSAGEEFGDRLLNSPIRKRDLFNYEFIERILAEHRSGKHEWSFYLWVLLNVSLWYEHWIEGSDG